MENPSILVETTLKFPENFLEALLKLPGNTLEIFCIDIFTTSLLELLIAAKNPLQNFDLALAASFLLEQTQCTEQDLFVRLGVITLMSMFSAN